MFVTLFKVQERGRNIAPFQLDFVSIVWKEKCARILFSQTTTGIPLQLFVHFNKHLHFLQVIVDFGNARNRFWRESKNVPCHVVSVKMETPGPYRGKRKDVEAYIAEFYRDCL